MARTRRLHDEYGQWTTGTAPARRARALGIFEDPSRPGELFGNELLSGLAPGSWTLHCDAESTFDIGYYDQDFHAEARPDHSWNQRMLAAYERSLTVDGISFEAEYMVSGPYAAALSSDDSASS